MTKTQAIMLLKIVAEELKQNAIKNEKDGYSDRASDADYQRDQLMDIIGDGFITLRWKKK